MAVAGPSVPDLGCFTLSEAAVVLGVSRQALHEGLKRYDLLRRCRRADGHRYVSVDTLDAYRARVEPGYVERLTEVPKGYLATREAAERVGCHPSLLHRAAKLGLLQVVRVAKAHYYPPAELERLRFDLNNTPPPGWAEVAAFATRLGRAPATALAWLVRHGHERRRYRRRRDRRLVTCARDSALEAWAHAHASARFP